MTLDKQVVGVVLSVVVAAVFGILITLWILAAKPASNDFAFIAEFDTLTSSEENLGSADLRVQELGRHALQREHLSLMEYRAFRERHKKDVFLSQLWATTAITRVAILTTVVGISLVLLQFIAALIKGDELEEAALEIGPQGLKVKTSFIGFLMIAFGLFFWLAFLEKAYEIKGLNAPIPMPVASPSADDA